MALKFFRLPQAVHEAVHGGRVDVAADDAVAVDEQLRKHRVRCSGIVCHAIGIDAARLAGVDGQVEALLLLQGVVIAEHAVKCAREHDLLRSFGRRISLPAECTQICDAPLGRGDVVVRREYAVVAAPDNQKRQHHRQRDERIDGRSSCPMKGFELHNHTPEQTYSNLPPDMLYYCCLTIEEGSDMIRLDKYLADTGAASRREAKMYIRRGEVTVDGVPAAAPEQKIAETAVVCLRGQPLHYQTYHYYMLHKPSGVLTATSDRSQPTVLDLFPPELQRFGLVPAGRLDKDTTGLLLITDDGDYVHRVITPKKHVPKVYFARTDGMPTSADAERFAQGVVLGDGTQCLPARLECLPEQGGCRVTVYEGKYHMVKRMLASCGTPVLQLHRLSIGALTLDPTLAPGAYRELSAEEAMLVFEEPAS